MDDNIAFRAALIDAFIERLKGLGPEILRRIDAAGAPFEDVVGQRILAPLGMTSTFWQPEDVPAGRLATTYEQTPAGPKRTRPVNRGAGSARGGIYSTVRDLARYVALQLSAYPPRNDQDDGPIRRATRRAASSPTSRCRARDRACAMARTRCSSGCGAERARGQKSRCSQFVRNQPVCVSKPTAWKLISWPAKMPAGGV